jgi:thioredoxin reductase (NADPH)
MRQALAPRPSGRAMLLFMVTPDEIASVPLFSALPGGERERLARVSADIHLVAGEYAVSEGDERALFAVLGGRIEVVKVIDGVDRVLGQRHPGDIFGEVPITLGMPFPAGYRAAEPSRILRLEAHDYHGTAATAPEIAVKVGEIARGRIGGLQHIVAEPLPPRAVVVGEQWDRSCSELRHFLDRNEITFEWIKREEASAADSWGDALPSGADCPAIRFADGTTIVRPSLREVADGLGLQTQPSDTEYDTVVIGAGPAGLAAAVYGASEGLRTIVIEREAPGGQAGTSSRIENYLGFPSGVSGDELGRRALQQAKRLGAEILVTRSITRIDAARRSVSLDGGDVLRARTIIVATGVTWRHLPIEGFERLVGKGLYYGAVRSEAPTTHGLDVHIVGAGNSAGQAALFFANHASSVTILCRRDTLEKSMSRYLVEQIGSKSNIHVALQSEVTAVHGDGSLDAIDILDRSTGVTTRHASGGLFIFIGADADTEWLPDEIALDDRGYVLTGADVRATGRWALERDPYLLETSVPGIFACGDVRSGPVKRVAAAVGDGSMAIAFVHQYLKDP